MAQNGDSSFLPMTASGAVPGGAPSFSAMTASGETLPERVPATADQYTSFLPMSGSGSSSAGSVAAGSGAFEEATAFAYGPQSTDISFERLTALGQGHTGTVAYADVSFAAASASVSQLGGSIALGAPRFQPLASAGTSLVTVVAAGAASFARAYGLAAGFGGSVASGAPSFVAFAVEAVGVEPSVSVGAITLMPMVVAGRSEEALANTWAAYHMNAGNDALTEYQNYRFNSMAAFNGRHLAAGDTGIVELSGVTDDEANINWSFRTGFMDGSDKGGLNGGDSAQLKHLNELLLAARLTGPVRIRVWVDENTHFDYNLPTYRPGVLNQVRAKLGKGLKSRFFRVELSGLNNAAAEISSMQLPLIPLRRRAG